MHRHRFILPVAAACLFLVAGSALAGSQTVKGQGDLKKITADNGRTAVTVKLYGFKGPCVARQFAVDIEWSTKPAYGLNAGCAGGTKWAYSLSYTADRVNQGFGGKSITCKGLKLTYAKSGSVWTAVLPRTCIRKAPDRVKVHVDGINYSGSAVPGVATTRLLSRG